MALKSGKGFEHGSLQESNQVPRKREDHSASLAQAQHVLQETEREAGTPGVCPRAAWKICCVGPRVH